MKKIFSIIIVMFLLCMIYEFIVLLLLRNYDYDYELTNGKNKYQINEVYTKKNGNHLYNIKIENKKNTYSFLVSHDYHKNKQIVKDVIKFSENNTECIMPVFKDNVTGGIACSKDNKIMSYNYLLNTDETTANKIKMQVQNKGYKLSLFSIDYEDIGYLKKTGPQLTYYKDFVPNYNVIVWEYKGVHSISKEKSLTNEFLLFDVYDSKYIDITDEKMYVMNADSKENSFDKIYAVNLKDGMTTTIDILSKTLSTNSYFNGVYKNDIYFMDCNSDTQYKINEKSQELEETSKENKIKYYDGEKLISKTVKSISNSNIKFKTDITNKEITKLYKTKDIRYSNGHYYFKDENNNVYMVMNDNYKESILLFKLDKFVEWKVVNDTVFGISGDTLYAYNNSYGLKPIVKYNEFNYRTTNMYSAIAK